MGLFKSPWVCHFILFWERFLQESSRSPELLRISPSSSAFLMNLENFHIADIGALFFIPNCPGSCFRLCFADEQAISSDLGACSSKEPPRQLEFQTAHDKADEPENEPDSDSFPRTMMAKKFQRK